MSEDGKTMTAVETALQSALDVLPQATPADLDLLHRLAKALTGRAKELEEEAADAKKDAEYQELFGKSDIDLPSGARVTFELHGMFEANRSEEISTGYELTFTGSVELQVTCTSPEPEDGATAPPAAVLKVGLRCIDKNLEDAAAEWRWDQHMEEIENERYDNDLSGGYMLAQLVGTFLEEGQTLTDWLEGDGRSLDWSAVYIDHNDSEFRRGAPCEEDLTDGSIKFALDWSGGPPTFKPRTSRVSNLIALWVSGQAQACVVAGGGSSGSASLCAPPTAPTAEEVVQTVEQLLKLPFREAWQVCAAPRCTHAVSASARPRCATMI